MTEMDAKRPVRPNVPNVRFGSKADIATHVVRRGNIRHYHYTLRACLGEVTDAAGG